MFVTEEVLMLFHGWDVQLILCGLYSWEGGGPVVMALGEHQLQLLLLMWASCMMCSRFLGRGVRLESFSPPPHRPYGRLQENLRIMRLRTSGPLLDACVLVGWGWTRCCWSGCPSRDVHHPAQPLRAADGRLLGPIRTVKVTRKPVPLEMWMQRCLVEILSQRTRRLWVCISAGVRLEWASWWGAGRYQAGPKRGKTSSLPFFPLLCSIVKKLLLALCPAKSKCSLPHLRFMQSKPVFL